MGRTKKINKVESVKQTCAVPNCVSNCGPNISLHNFPSEKELSSKWKTFCKLRHTGAVPKKYRVCSAHFSSDSFVCDEHPASTEFRQRLLLANGMKNFNYFTF